MTKSIAPIFGSDTKVKVMRLFIFNKGAIYTAKTVEERVKESQKKVRKELATAGGNVTVFGCTINL